MKRSARRRVAGIFAIDTALKLQQIKREYPKLDVQTCTCMMKSNQERIFEWYDYLKYELKPDKVNVNYIRPPSARPEELNIDLNRYRRLTEQIDQDSRQGLLKNHYGGKGGYFKAAIDIYMHRYPRATEEQHSAQLVCHAGNTGGVIYDEGTVSSCENLPPVGNLRDYNWDFMSLRRSKEMAEREQGPRRLLLHGMNQIATIRHWRSTPLIWSKIKGLERRLKKQSQPAVTSGLNVEASRPV